MSLSFSSELPVRLAFFGDELDKLREFDPASQRSLDPIDSLRLTPTGFSPLMAYSLRDRPLRSCQNCNVSLRRTRSP